MGRPSLPTSLKKLRGTLQPSRVNSREPTPLSGAPTAPSHLSADAAAFWSEVTRVLTDMRVLATSDGLAVCALCETLADLAAARASLGRPVKSGRRIIAKAGARFYTTASRTGAVMVRSRPELAVIADGDRRLMAWLSRFGLSPADRARVSEIAGAAPNPFLRHGRPPDAFDAWAASAPKGAEVLPAPPTFDEYLASDPDLKSTRATTQRRVP